MAIQIKDVRRTDDPLVFAGVRADTQEPVRFKVTPKESKELIEVMTGDLGLNFDGVVVEQDELIKEDA